MNAQLPFRRYISSVATSTTGLLLTVESRFVRVLCATIMCDTPSASRNDKASFNESLKSKGTAVVSGPEESPGLERRNTITKRSQASVEWMKKYYLKTLVVLIRWAFIVLLCVVLLGSGLNYHALKYSASRGTDCKHGLLTLNVPDSHHCCDSSVHYNDWVCAATFDPVNKFISSFYGYFLALSPFIINSVVDMVKGSSNDVGSRKGIIKRLAFYIALYVFRRLCLYDLPRMLQTTCADYMLSWSWSGAVAKREQEQQFWAREFVHRRKWGMDFDFSDHVVLFVVVFIIPAVLELHYALTREIVGRRGGDGDVTAESYFSEGGDTDGVEEGGMCGDGADAVVGGLGAKKECSNSSNSSSGDDKACPSEGSREANSKRKARGASNSASSFHTLNLIGDSVPGPVKVDISIWHILQTVPRLGWYAVPAFVALFIFVLSMRQVIFTCMFFHTPAENLVGLALAVVSVFFFGTVLLGVIVAANNTA